MRRRPIDALRFECALFHAARRSRSCLPSWIAILLGLGYLLVPIDLIPDRIPFFGHLDEIGFVLAGALIGRLLLPAELRIETAARYSLPQPTKPIVALARLRSDLLAQHLMLRRRLVRLAAHTRAAARTLRSRCIAAATERSWRERLFTLLGYRLWWYLQTPFSRPRSERDSLIVIGGAGRSGTTLLRAILGRHPAIASLPETTVFLRRISAPEAIAARLGWDAAEIAGWQRQSHSQMEFIERFHDAVFARSGRRVWAEKTPKNVLYFRFVRRRFPQARLVHVVRDGRDVVCSLRRKSFAKLDHLPPDSIAAARRCAVQWRESVRAGLRLRGNPRYHEVRYEDLVRYPQPTLRALLAFLGLPWDDRLLSPTPGFEDPFETAAGSPIFATSAKRWRHDLTAADQDALRLLIGPLLVELGYENSLDWRSPPCPHTDALDTAAGLPA
jgi:protein-tyrosine sulfotransferase